MYLHLEKPTEQEISMKWVAKVGLIPGFGKNVTMATDGPADPAQLIKVRATYLGTMSHFKEPAVEEGARAFSV